MTARRRATRCSWMLTAALTGCVTSATNVEVQLDTDAPEGRAFEVSAFTFRGTTPPATREPLVIERGSGDGQAAFPLSFGVVPTSGSGRDHPVTLVLDAVLRGRSSSEPDLRFRRTARWQFSRGVHGQVRIFLPVRCGTLTTGCANTPPQHCTVAALCDERSLTCGDDGTCVAPEVTVTPRTDAGFDSSTPTMDSGGSMDATALDVMRDAVAEDTAPTDTGVRVDTGVITDTGVSNNGRSCSGSGTCTGGNCVSGNYGGGICSSACSTRADCPPSWTCAGTVCHPPTTCTGGFVWTDWNGDGSLQLAAMRRLGVSATGSSFTFACTDATSLLQMCEDQLDLTLTAARASVLGGLIAPRAMPAATPTVRLTAPSATSVHLRIDNSATPFNITIDAPNTVVALDLAGARTLNIVGTSTISRLVINAPMTPIHVMGTINGPTTFVANGGFTNTGRVNGTLQFGGAPVAAPACR